MQPRQLHHWSRVRRRLTYTLSLSQSSSHPSFHFSIGARRVTAALTYESPLCTVLAVKEGVALDLIAANGAPLCTALTAASAPRGEASLCTD